jgi:hypothetical protein
MAAAKTNNDLRMRVLLQVMAGAETAAAEDRLEMKPVP